MASLQFKGKAFVQNYHLMVKHHELVPCKKKSLADTVSLHDNVIIHGDNLKALKALLPTHAGKVKCIYIDPPYNTGGDWKYNDSVASPMMQEWLGKVVERDDLTRHDKWLCMMLPRLRLLKELLHKDGVFLVSINDIEVAGLILLLNEVFGEENQIGMFVWKSRAKPTNAGEAKYRPQKVAEYVIAYARKESNVQYFRLESGETRSYPHTDKKGKYRTTTILTSNRGVYKRITMRCKIGDYTPPEDQRWKAGDIEIKKLYSDGYIDFRDGVPFLKHYEHEEEDLHEPFYTFISEDVSGTAESGKAELNELIGNQHAFDTVKPTSLISLFLRVFTKGEDIILDSFAGSGTTAHAVLELNKEDGGNRKFLLIECEDYADKITAERVRRVIKGVPEASDNTLKQGTGGTFSYFELGQPLDVERLFDPKRLPTYEELAKYVFFTATGEEFNPKNLDEKRQYIGATKEFEFYLFYKPDVAYLKNAASLTLDRAKDLGKPRGKRRIVFAPTKYLNQDHLDEFRIEFAQLPFEVYKLVE